MTFAALLSSTLNPLELRIMEVLWAADGPRSVHSLRPQFPDEPYTTLMTAMDRLFRKRVLQRYKASRAFWYSPMISRHEHIMRLTRQHIQDLLPEDSRAASVVLASFVESVTERDVALLDELETLVRDRRAAIAR